MPFAFADEFFAELDDARVLSIAGRPGAGKTFMAHELAEYYLSFPSDHYINRKYGYPYRLISNIEGVWNDQYHISLPIQDGAYDINLLPDPQIWQEVKPYAVRDGFAFFVNISHSVLILDEGGRWLRQWKFFENMFEYPRKFDNYILIPSRRIAHATLAEFIVRPSRVNLKKIMGIPWTIWKWKVDDGDEVDTGFFVHRTANERFGIYDTYDLSASPKRIISAYTAAILQRQTQDYQRETDDIILEVENTGTDAEETRLIAEIFGRSLETFQNNRKRK